MSDQESNPEESPAPEETSTLEVSPISPDVPFTDPRLRFAYPIIEVAKIAAALNRSTMRDRVYGAIALLEATERHALNPDPAKFRNLEIFRSAERDKKNGLILQTELILGICAAVGKKCKPETAREKYREWIKEDWEINAFDYDETTNVERTVSFEDHEAHFETGKKTKYVTSDAAAKVIIEQFSRWLKEGKSSNDSILFRAADTKKIVSKKDKGAGRNKENGLYGNKPTK